MPPAFRVFYYTQSKTVIITNRIPIYAPLYRYDRYTKSRLLTELSSPTSPPGSQPTPKNIQDLLYEAYNDTTGMDNEEIEADFEKLCRRSLKEIDEVIYAVSSLCRDHEEERLVEGVRVEMGLSKEVNIS